MVKMKTKAKKFLCLILSLAMMVSVFAGLNITAYALSYTSGNLSVDLTSGVLTVSGTGKGADYDGSFGKRPTWYTLRAQITSVVINEGVQNIGAYWFYGCTNLKSVTIASTVDTLGTACFKDCTSLQTVKIPDATQYIWTDVFSGCTSLKYIELPSISSSSDYDYKNTVPTRMFYGCTSLEEVMLGEDFTAIGDSAFSGCTALRGIYWRGSTITKIDSTALLSVPSSCRLVGASSISSATTALTYQSNEGSCGDNLKYSYNPSTKTLSISGYGDMTSNDWSVYHYFISIIDFSGVSGSFTIMANAFSGAVNSTYYVDIPAECTAIGNKAFYQTNFNYVKIMSPSVTMGTDVFGDGSGGYARFFGVTGSGVYDYVKTGQSSGYDWHYYCLNHNYTYTTIAPTCTEQGYDIVSCNDCDEESFKANYTEKTGHTYVYSGTSGASVLYSCSKCGATNLAVDAASLLSGFVPAITTDDKAAPYSQTNYDGRYDINKNGYINAKDFSLLNKIINNIDTTDKETTIDTSTSYQTIEGFGASAAWWAQYVGGWDNLDEITELLYSKENGAGLNIYRYNLGAGPDDSITNWDRKPECFLQSDGTYDFTKDANAQKALASAQKANSDLRVTLFANSAPISMTSNGHAFCSGTQSTNLAESKYQSFADYIVKCTEYFIDNGYNVTDVSPINEPEWNWNEGSQEGCYYSDENVRTFYNDYMIPTLQKNEKLNGKVSVSPWECAQLYYKNDGSIFSGYLDNLYSTGKSSLWINPTDYSQNNGNIRSYTDSFSTHSYWASQSDRENVAKLLADSTRASIKKVRCTEYCQMTGDSNSGVYALIQQEGTTNGLGIEYGLALADIMYQDLTILNAVEWDWWVACGPGVYPDSLIYVNTDNHSDIQVSKRLWVMGNYARFIDEGATRVAVSTGSKFGSSLTTNNVRTYTSGSTTYTDKNNYIEQTAYKNPDGTVVVVYINNSDTNEYTKFDSAQYSSFETYVTSDDLDLEKYQSGNMSKAVSIPAKSVTTVVLTPAS